MHQGSPIQSAASTSGSSEAADAGGMAMNASSGEASRKQLGNHGEAPNFDQPVRCRCAGINSPVTGMVELRGDSDPARGPLIYDRGGSDMPAAMKNTCGVGANFGVNLHREYEPV